MLKLYLKKAAKGLNLAKRFLKIVAGDIGKLLEVVIRPFQVLIGVNQFLSPLLYSFFQLPRKDALLFLTFPQGGLYASLIGNVCINSYGRNNLIVHQDRGRCTTNYSFFAT